MLNSLLLAKEFLCEMKKNLLLKKSISYSNLIRFYSEYDFSVKKALSFPLFMFFSSMTVVGVFQIFMVVMKVLKSDFNKPRDVF